MRCCFNLGAWNREECFDPLRRVLRQVHLNLSHFKCSMGPHQVTWRLKSCLRKRVISKWWVWQWEEKNLKDWVSSDLVIFRHLRTPTKCFGKVVWSKKQRWHKGLKKRECKGKPKRKRLMSSKLKRELKKLEWRMNYKSSPWGSTFGTMVGASLWMVKKLKIIQI